MRKDKKEAIWVTPNVHKKLKVLAAISDENVGDIASKVIDGLTFCLFKHG